MNVKTLADKPEKMNDCLELIEQAFNYDDQQSYKDDFTLLFQHDNLENCFFTEDDNGTVTATLFTLPRVMEYKDLKLPVLFLGGISVRDENRGAGLFKSLLETILLLNPHYAFYLLWSDLAQLYEKFSFYEFGLIEEKDLTDHETDDLEDFHAEDTEHLIRSYQDIGQNFLIPHRKPHDWHVLFTNRSVDLLESPKGHIYCINKGMDLKGICHERHPFNAPMVNGYINWNYSQEIKSNNNLRYMGFMRLGNLEVISDFIYQTSNHRLEILGKNEEYLRVSFDGEPYDLKERDFIQGLWGPGQVEEWKGLVPNIIVFGFDSI